MTAGAGASDPIGAPHVAQIPYSVIADMSPAERLKYEGHFSKVKGTGGSVDIDRAKRFFSKAALPVSGQAADFTASAPSLRATIFRQ